MNDNLEVKRRCSVLWKYLSIFLAGPVGDQRFESRCYVKSEFLKCQKKNMFNFFSKDEMKWVGSDVSSQTYFSYIVILPQNNLRKAVCVTFAGHVKGLCSLVSQPRTFLLNVWSLFILTQKLDFKYLGYFNVAQKLANLFVHSLLSLISLYLALLFEMELWVRCMNKRNSACWLLCFYGYFPTWCTVCNSANYEVRLWPLETDSTMRVWSVRLQRNFMHCNFSGKTTQAAHAVLIAGSVVNTNSFCSFIRLQEGYLLPWEGMNTCLCSKTDPLLVCVSVKDVLYILEIFRKKKK